MTGARSCASARSSSALPRWRHWRSEPSADGSTAIRSLPILFVTGVARAFDTPTMHTLVPGLVPPALLPRAIAATAVSATQTAVICGPAMSGLIYYKFGRRRGLCDLRHRICCGGRADQLDRSCDSSRRNESRSRCKRCLRASPISAAGQSFWARCCSIYSRCYWVVFRALLPIFARDVSAIGR